MATGDICAVGYATAMTQDDAILVEIDGKPQRVKLSDFANIVQQEGTILQQIAWGIPLKEISSTAWGVVGNTLLRDAYEAKCGRYFVKNDGSACKLKTTQMGDASAGTVTAADGTTIDQTTGHIMHIAPRLYYLVKTIDGTPYVWLSEMPISKNCLETADGYICQGAFPAYVGTVAGTASCLTSRMGVVPSNNQSISTFFARAQNNGSFWGLTNYDVYRWRWLYGVGHYGNTNIQAQLGNGLCGTGDNWSAASALTTGATAALGDAFGNVAVSSGTSACHVNLGGIENPYGLRWEMLQGIFFGNSGNTAQTGSEVFIYKGNRMPTSTELASHPAGEYRQTTRQTGSSGSYVTKMLLGENFDLLASAKSGGGSSSYYADAEYCNDTGQLCLVGGSADRGLYCGLACVYSGYAFSGASAYVGSRLAYYGKLTFKDGRNM
jgi:hypothetical protein